GQSNYLNEVFDQYKERTFSDAKAFIFVVDISDASNIMRSKYYFDLTMENAVKLAEGSKIYVFAHKMDVVAPNKREPVLQSIKDIFEIDDFPNAELFGTSIFEETIWDAMQQILAFVYLVKLKNDLAKMFSPTLMLEYATFSFDDNRVYMKEIDADLILTTVFPPNLDVEREIEYFNTLTTEMKQLFQTDELIGRARIKVKGALESYLVKNGIEKSDLLERRIEQNINYKCDVCGRNLQKSIIDVAVESAEQLERGIKIQKGFGAISVELFPSHECVEGIREVPIFLDGQLEYRRYDDSRPV
ncbi:MAG: hypothetical protein ACTSQC_12670, partial [Candidatus Heimdallarchaeaceae archaeon]